MMHVTLSHYLALAGLLFAVGAAGFLVRRNLLIQLMSIELMLNAVNLLLVTFNRQHASGAPGAASELAAGSQAGQVFTFFVIAVAAAEAAVGLAIAVSLFRLKKTVQSDSVEELRH